MYYTKLPYVELLEHYNRNNKLYEGLIISYPKEQLILRIMSLQELPKIKLHISHPKQTILNLNIYLNGYIELNKIYDVLSEANPIYGWSISKLLITNAEGLKSNIRTLENLLAYTNEINSIQIIFEMKHPSQVVKVPDILYHVSPTKYSKKILKTGLVPKSKNSEYSYDDRIYFIDSEEYRLALINILNTTNTNQHWSIFKIDTTSFILNGIMVYMDPMFGNDNLPFNSYFTRNNIPPFFITLQGVVDLNKLPII